MRRIVHAAVLATIGTAGWFAQTSPTLAACGNGVCRSPIYGIASVSPDQFPRIILFNATAQGKPACATRVDLIGGGGARLGSATRYLAPGQSIVLNEDAFLVPGSRPYRGVRPGINFITPDSCSEVITTFEVVDRESGSVDLIYPASASYARDPVFGFDKTTSDYVARIWLVNTAPSEGCVASVEFFDRAGHSLSEKTMAALFPGQSLKVEQAGGVAMRPVLQLKPKATCGNVISTVEMVETGTGKARFVWPLSPNP